MKRLFFVFLAVVVLGVLCFVFVGQKDEPPRPAFPLDEAVITVALEKSGLPGILSESESSSSGDGQRMHVLRSPTLTYSDHIRPEEAAADPGARFYTAGIISANIEGERVLTTTFVQINVSDQMTWEAWRQEIVFAALLYGFEEGDEIYRAFADKEFPHGETFSQWDAQFPEGYCVVNYRFFDEASDPPQRAHAILRVNLYESQSLYQKLQELTVQAVAQAVS